jgi:hypothetical protein
MVVLKIPVLGSIWIVWWASHQEVPQPEETEDDGGNKRRKMPPKLPRGPRRGPHGGGIAKPLPDPRRSGGTRVVKPAPQPAFARAGSHGDKDESRPRRYDA